MTHLKDTKNALDKKLDKLAVFISDHVGSMYTTFVFAIVGVMGVVGALTGNTKMVLIVGAVSGYFLQLVLLPIIMVADKIGAESVKAHVTKKHEELKAHITKTHKKG